jgi:hypothetical protein
MLFRNESIFNTLMNCQTRKFHFNLYAKSFYIKKYVFQKFGVENNKKKELKIQMFLIRTYILASLSCVVESFVKFLLESIR